MPLLKLLGKSKMLATCLWVAKPTLSPNFQLERKVKRWSSTQVQPASPTRPLSVSRERKEQLAPQAHKEIRGIKEIKGIKVRPAPKALRVTKGHKVLSTQVPAQTL
jgi:hypothetical protein